MFLGSLPNIPPQSFKSSHIEDGRMSADSPKVFSYCLRCPTNAGVRVLHC